MLDTIHVLSRHAWTQIFGLKPGPETDQAWADAWFGENIPTSVFVGFFLDREKATLKAASLPDDDMSVLREAGGVGPDDLALAETPGPFNPSVLRPGGKRALGIVSLGKFFDKPYYAPAAAFDDLPPKPTPEALIFVDPRLVLISIRTWFDKFDFLVRPTAEAIRAFAESTGINALASTTTEREKKRALFKRVADEALALADKVRGNIFPASDAARGEFIANAKRVLESMAGAATTEISILRDTLSSGRILELHANRLRALHEAYPGLESEVARFLELKKTRDDALTQFRENLAEWNANKELARAKRRRVDEDEAKELHEKMKRIIHWFRTKRGAQLAEAALARKGAQAFKDATPVVYVPPTSGAPLNPTPSGLPPNPVVAPPTSGAPLNPTPSGLPPNPVVAPPTVYALPPSGPPALPPPRPVVGPPAGGPSAPTVPAGPPAPGKVLLSADELTQLELELTNIYKVFLAMQKYQEELRKLSRSQKNAVEQTIATATDQTHFAPALLLRSEYNAEIQSLGYQTGDISSPNYVGPKYPAMRIKYYEIRAKYTEAGGSRIFSPLDPPGNLVPEYNSSLIWLYSALGDRRVPAGFKRESMTNFVLLRNGDPLPEFARYLVEYLYPRWLLATKTPEEFDAQRKVDAAAVARERAVLEVEEQLEREREQIEETKRLAAEAYDKLREKAKLTPEDLRDMGLSLGLTQELQRPEPPGAMDVAAIRGRFTVQSSRSAKLIHQMARRAAERHGKVGTWVAEVVAQKTDEDAMRVLRGLF